MNLEAALGGIPRALSSHYHVLALIALGFYLIVLPLCGVHVPASAELIGGNYTNVTSDIGACIAAGMSVRVARQHKSLHDRFDALEKLFRGDAVDGIQEPDSGRAEQPADSGSTVT